MQCKAVHEEMNIHSLIEHISIKGHWTASFSSKQLRHHIFTYIKPLNG